MKATLRLLALSITACLYFNAAATGWKWYNPMDAGYDVVQNQAWTTETGRSYYRLPDRSRSNVRVPVWNLSRNSAGLAVHFYSNAPEIKLRYVVEGPLQMHHMPSTGVSGTDLYAVDQHGTHKHFFGFFNSNGDTVTTRFVNDRMNEYHNCGYEFQLYLPLYNGVKWLEIGIPDTNDLQFIPTSTEKPIVVYGTSIEQGGVASRPGMAWPTIVQRSLEMPLVNLGFSGNGRLEQGILDLMAEVDARLYILACMANLTERSHEELDSLITNAVNTLRAANDAPIILMEHPGFSDTAVDSTQNEIIERLNTAAKVTYDKLLRQGVKDLHYVTREQLAVPYDGWVDNVHPSDLGMSTMAAAMEHAVRTALRMPKGDIPTTAAVKQRREAGGYEWLKRHSDILARNAANPPKNVIIGNSITHYWGGEPTAQTYNGLEVWNKHLAPAGFGNLGCGWDRIENALWRVYHGELDGYDAQQVVVMIGTNNLYINTPEEIAEGIRTLLRAIRDRQPAARIKTVGLLPRRNALDTVETVNTLIERVAAEENAEYINPGRKMLSKDGSLDESLFTDGLHPNNKGYARIVDDILK